MSQIFSGDGDNDEISGEELPAPKSLISQMVNSLQSDKDTDVELLEILSAHILTMTPAATAVSDAAKQINLLAARRAEAKQGDNPN